MNMNTEPLDYYGSPPEYLRIKPEPYFPKVLIAGAGIGGLTLGLLLQKANIDFAILEQKETIKPLGSVALGTGIAPLFQQLGIYDDFKKLGKPYTQLELFNEDLTPELVQDCSWIHEASTYQEYILRKADLSALLLSQLPQDKVHLNKRVLSFDFDDNNVIARCSDGSVLHGDILVGADGTHSVVRQHMYKILKAKGILPAADEAPLPYSSIALSGETEVLSTEEFPALKAQVSQFASVLGTENLCTWNIASTAKNTIVWTVVRFLPQETSTSVESLEWSAEAAQAMCNEVRGFKVPGGKDGKVLTLGDLIDRTPKGSIVKKPLEEKVFNTWYGARAVLIGDACHKLHPSGGVSTLNAITDAVTLANWIKTLPSSSLFSLHDALREYHSERHPLAREALDRSALYNTLVGKTVVSSTVRAVVKHVLPTWFWRRLVINNQLAVRPQVSFLPLVKEKGSVSKVHQASLEKTRKILERAGS
ncbi:hypothetical protein MVEG_08366 [Podila verticillata NRRL 6337]|nr:hypothetical protein MVEG_08366 [Podila verticillata NRRL 6337]